MSTNREIEIKRFNFDTMQNFDEHIDLSIPNYRDLWGVIGSLSTNFIKPSTNVYDLGCSTGVGLESMEYINNLDNVSYIGYDTSINLIQQKNIESRISLKLADITKDSFNMNNASLILSIFTLQFIPISKRQGLISKVYNALNFGGAFIVAEKIYMNTGQVQSLFEFSHYDYKRKAFSADEILSKQMDLRTIMNPLSENDNIEMFKRAGFVLCESFFQSLNFKAWVLIK